MLLIIIGADMVVAIKLLTARFRIKYIPVILSFLYLMEVAVFSVKNIGKLPINCLLGGYMSTAGTFKSCTLHISIVE